MKILIAIFAFIAISVSAFAYNGPHQNVSATMHCNVIQLLAAVATSAMIDLPEAVIAGQTHNYTTAVPVSFTFTGQAGQGVAFTTSVEEESGDDVVLLGSWGTIPTALAAGNNIITYTVTGLDATDAPLTDGTYQFSIHISAAYTAY